MPFPIGGHNVNEVASRPTAGRLVDVLSDRQSVV